MKAHFVSIAFTLFGVLSAISVHAQDKTYKLTVYIPEIASRVGKLYVGLANNEDTFTNASWKTATVDVPATGEITIVFDGLPAGQYGVRLFQDLNGNKELDMGGIIPSEPFGFSKITMLLGPPDFSDAAFELTGDMRVKVLMLNQRN